ncbi:hypothetical protein [Acidovorax sp. SUPP2539]|uniref:hypothetical protein n=1 Tax=Acidovorax sp. SUPP2539 TaxID=2920878 RepID=UPI0023DE329C|nr:hypothetical protein [Acidovorax sp. SUPP2539]GKS88371.1 hypothetical protein AVTE2539_03420 [Acidovorax sp. SUPP2539]
MVQLTEITSPPRVARSVEERIQEVAPQRRSSSMSAATLGLQGRALTLQTKPEDSGPPPTRRPPPPKLSRPAGVLHRGPAVSGTAASASATRAAELAEARAGKAKAVASPGRSGPPPVEDTAQWRDVAAGAILKMEWYVGDPGKSVSESPAAMQIRINRLLGMADLKADALRFQSEMRKQMNGVDGSAEPERYKNWVQAVSVNLEAVFQKAEVAAEAAAHGMQALLNAVSEAGADSDSDSDTDFLDASAEFVSDSDSDPGSDSDVELETEVDAAASTHVTTATGIDTPPALSGPSPQAEISGMQPPARSLSAEGIGLDFRPSGAASDQENGLALRNKIEQLERLQASRDQFSPADAARIDRALDDLSGRMKELKQHLREKGIPESLFFRMPTPLHEIEATRERRRREAQEALDLGHYTF